jgi:glycosyltransferase-like protein
MREGTPLRIGLLTHSVNPRGGVVHTVELAEALQDAGHAVTVMAPAAPGQRLFRELRCAVELVEVPGAAASTREMIQTRIAAYMRHLSGRVGSRSAGDFDVLHAQDGIGGNALASLCDESVIGGFVRTVHHVDHFGDPEIDALQARAICRARKVVCVSDVWRHAVEGDYGVCATVIANGVNRRRFSPVSAASGAAADRAAALRRGLRPRAPLIVCVGGIEQRKNTVRILQAFQRLRRRWPRAQLAVVGGASLLDHSRYRAGFDAALRAAALCEGFGLVALESLACGTPTVVSRIAPFTEYLADGEVEWAEPLDVESIAAALTAAVLRGKFTPPAVCERCSWDASAARHIALYREFLRPGPARRRSAAHA